MIPREIHYILSVAIHGWIKTYGKPDLSGGTSINSITTSYVEVNTQLFHQLLAHHKIS
jgi:hypothetical protein